MADPGARRAEESTISSMEEECLIERRRTATLKECFDILHRDGVIRYNRDTFRRLFQDEVFLEKFFILFDQDRDNHLVQDEWIEFLKERLTNEKQADFIDQIESVAYVLCGEEPVNLVTFQQIFRAKGVVDKLYRLIDQENTGSVSTVQVMEFITSISNTRPRAGFDKGNLERLEKIFKQTVGNEREIRREEFKKIVISKNPFFTERVFQIFDKDNSGTISLQEFLDSMHQFAGKTSDDKIKFLFKVYDIDGDGLIQHRELQHVMRACMEENGMNFSEEQIEDLTIALFEDADQDNRGAITFEALKRQLEKHDGLLENLSISIDRWLVPPKPEPAKQSCLRVIRRLRPYQLTKPYMKNHYVYISFLSLFLLINVALFVSRAFQYRHSNGYVILARACGQCLNFDCTFILVLMLRQCITFLRTHGFSSVLPLDQHIYLHKLTGVLIGIFSTVHTLMHLLNFSTVVIYDPQLNKENYTLTEWLITSKPGLFGLVPGGANPTGVALIIILAVMTLCSMPFVRRGGCFEIFYWSHLLYVPFWLLTIFHGPNFWKWFVGPGVIYMVERIRRLIWLRSQRGKTYISSGLLLPSKVTHLVIKRPQHFDFCPGDYVFVNIPEIARYEWHPFTISSAPEQEDYMWLHIRAVGEWTNSLYSYFEREQMRLHRGEVAPVEACTSDSARTKYTPSPLSARPVFAIEKDTSSKCLEVPRGFDNPRFIPDLDLSPSPSSVRSYGSAPSSERPVDVARTPRDKKLHQLLLGSKMPLEKSFSMPDMQTKNKKRERLIALRDYMRSESERSFDECQIRRARLKSLGLAYLSPQNKSLAQSFRYMRMKPTIIAFKTPSLENCEYEVTPEGNSAASEKMSPAGRSSSGLRIAEEGRIIKRCSVDDPRCMNETFKSEMSHSPMNYPVGKPLEIFLDGPYGTPSSHIFQAQHAVLIATGIGVTPFASILQSIMHRYWKARHTCPKCTFSWASEIPPTVMYLRKVDFFWINRNQHSFEWFVNLLSQLEMEQAELGVTMERFLEMHMYITSALQKNDMKAVGLQLAMDLLHEKEKRDLITGLKTRTNAGRPNWDKVFKQLQDQKKGKVTVFYCGPPQLARILRYKCDQFGFNFRKEAF
ncbi:NADPH oxidase 5 isoform X2 [Cephus cinctus]|uniref:NADPH oxidase 5 isoform X2 n=1 Tax=Cephus cinctus TaxID=211228 RepID=A0AAJ7BVE8_CEPCN|nr:NADPH oxidase 5 isoform X2 [Cephus cinctus]